ncbi:MAG: hypothetical protein HY423_16195 [Candidatus Lambdaproteobacteria bacterium]|nr:hypothetical protein [Candidatus Lambdaproteobacteria bacterium]
MPAPIHTSRIRIVPEPEKVKRAYIEPFTEPVFYGVHSGIAAFYGVTPKVQYPATLDHIVGGVGG